MKTSSLTRSQTSIVEHEKRNQNQNIAEIGLN